MKNIYIYQNPDPLPSLSLPFTKTTNLHQWHFCFSFASCPGYTLAFLSLLSHCKVIKISCRSVNFCALFFLFAFSCKINSFFDQKFILHQYFVFFLCFRFEPSLDLFLLFYLSFSLHPTVLSIIVVRTSTCPIMRGHVIKP